MPDTFLKWLLANPFATGLLLVAFALVTISFVLIIFIILRASIRGDEIQTPLFKIGSRLGVQTGTVNLPEVDMDGTRKNTFFEPGKYKGIRTLRLRISFKPPFKRKPEIAVSLRLIDLGDHDNPHEIKRLEVYALNEDKDGFELYFKTWEDSKVYNAAATWIAFGET
jgi:hypothetical protein